MSEVALPASLLDQGWMKFLEVKTKVTTWMVFLLCVSFSWMMKWQVHWLPTVLYVVSMLAVDLATTGINNYMGYKKEGETLSVKPKTGRFLIGFLFGLAIVLGLLLVIVTKNILILFVGGICFLVGAMYTAGPLPIAATPLGELLSGGVQGYLNMLIYLLINVPAGHFVYLTFEGAFIRLHMEWYWILAFLLFAWIPTPLIANVMLANNTCDLEKDEAIGRYTLPHYLGKQNSLTLHQWLYYSAYIAVIALVLMQVFTPWQLLMLVTVLPVHKNIMRFKARQVKAETFGLSLANLMLIMLSLTATFVLAAIFG